MSMDSRYEHEVMVLREQCDNGEITEQEYDETLREMDHDRTEMERDEMDRDEIEHW